MSGSQELFLALLHMFIAIDVTCVPEAAPLWMTARTYDDQKSGAGNGLLGARPPVHRGSTQSAACPAARIMVRSRIVRQHVRLPASNAPPDVLPPAPPAVEMHHADGDGSFLSRSHWVRNKVGAGPLGSLPFASFRSARPGDSLVNLAEARKSELRGLEGLMGEPDDSLVKPNNLAVPHRERPPAAGTASPPHYGGKTAPTLMSPTACDASAWARSLIVGTLLACADCACTRRRDPDVCGSARRSALRAG